MHNSYNFQIKFYFYCEYERKKINKVQLSRWKPNRHILNHEWMNAIHEWASLTNQKVDSLRFLFD